MSKQKSLTAITALVVLLCIAGLAWLRQPYNQTPARQAAEQFHALLKAGQFEQAFALTAQHGLTGNTVTDLKAIASRHCLDASVFKYTFPAQTNGNRLRRLLTGRTVEMEQVSVEFEGTCLLEIRLRQAKNGAWLVVYFASHAG